MPSDCEIVVVGAGAAGLLAAIRAAELGRRTLLVEKNARPGVKILMSGGTRCNLTHAGTNRDIIDAYGLPGQFLHSALAALSVEQTVGLFEAEGVRIKIEETGKIFPVSNKATDVLAALLARLNRSGAELALAEPVRDIHLQNGEFEMVTSNRTVVAKKVIITTGGVSYPASGTTGDGYAWAAKFGHTIVEPRPALVPVTVEAPWVRSLRGVTVPDVAVRVVERLDAGPCQGEKELAMRRGSLLFTHFGLSGPVVLDVSRVISGHAQPASLALACDFLPAVKPSELDEMLRQAAAVAGKKQLLALIPEAVPRRLAAELLRQAGLDPATRSSELRREDRARIAHSLKHTELRVSGTMGFKKAEVTAGGVALNQVNSSTMQSKLVPGLFLAGEILDLDGPIGGYNFQAAWSTGWLAGQSAAKTISAPDIPSTPA